MLYEWLQVLQADPLNSNIRCIEIAVDNDVGISVVVE